MVINNLKGSGVSNFLFIIRNLPEPSFYLCKFTFYSRSLRFGFREGSLERKPNVNKDIKKITTVYTRIFKVNILLD